MVVRSSSGEITQPMLSKHRSGHFIPLHVRSPLCRMQGRVKQLSFKSGVLASLGILLLVVASVTFFHGSGRVNRARQQSDYPRFGDATMLLARTFGLSSQNEAKAFLEALQEGTLDYEAVVATLEDVESKKIAEIKAAADAEAAKKTAEAKAAAEREIAEKVAAARAAAERETVEKVAAAKAAAERATAENVAAATAEAKKVAARKETANRASNRLRSRKDDVFDGDIDDEDDLGFGALDEEDDALFDSLDDDGDALFEGFNDEDGDDDIDDDDRLLDSVEDDLDEDRVFLSSRREETKRNSDSHNKRRSTPASSQRGKSPLLVRSKSSRLNRMRSPSSVSEELNEMDRHQLENDSDDEYDVDFSKGSSLQRSYQQTHSPDGLDVSKSSSIDVSKARKRLEHGVKTRSRRSKERRRKGALRQRHF